MPTTLRLIRRVTNRACRTCRTYEGVAVWAVIDADGTDTARTFLCGECAA